MTKFLLLLATSLFLATNVIAQQSNRGFYRGGLSSGFIVFFVSGNGELAVYTSDFGKMSAGGGSVSSDTAFFSFDTFAADKSTAGQITGTLSADSVSGNFTPNGSAAEAFTATRVPIFGSTAEVAGRYFGVAFTGTPLPYVPFTLLLDSQGRVVVSGLGTDSISSVQKTGFGGRFIDPIGPDVEQEFYEANTNATLISGPNTNVTIAHDVMFGTFKANGTTYQFRASRESSANHLANISTRGPVSHLQNSDFSSSDIGQLIAGFIITGGPKLVLIRAIGPSLSFSLCMFGCSGNPPPWLQNPMVQLYRGGSQNPIAVNDDWQTNANAADINATTVPPSDPKESALLLRLEPGAYTAVVTGSDGGTGVAVVEVYEIDKD
jgi:hypothetical protein